MFWSEIKDVSGTIKVDGNPVWDYKIVNEGELSLISEPVPGSEEYPKVTVEEISEYVGLFTDLVLISETDRSEITSNRIEVCN